MSDAENFVARWSRLKRGTAEEKMKAGAGQPDPKPSDADAIAGEQEAEAGSPATGGPAKAPFDPASLPPIDSITAASDIRAFLQSGVPVELTKAALRRVWTTDPAIRDFIGIAENQWDFTDPTAMPGFGPLEATDDVRDLVAQAMGRLSEPSGPSVDDGSDPVPDAAPRPGAAPPSSVAQPPSNAHGQPQVSGMPDGNKVGDDAVGSVEHQSTLASVAPQHTSERAEVAMPSSRRPHGRALPQ